MHGGRESLPEAGGWRAQASRAGLTPPRPPLASARSAHLPVPGRDTATPRRAQSHLQIFLAHTRVGRQLRRRAAPHYAALLDHHMTIGEALERIDMLVHQQDGKALALQAREARPDLRADQWR